MSNFTNKREIKSIKINSKVEILKLLNESNQNLGYMTYLSAGKFEPENRFDMSFIQIKDTFINSNILNLPNMQKLIELLFNFKNVNANNSEVEILPVMSIFSFTVLFTSDIFTLFALPNKWDDSLSYVFSGHIQQLGLPSDVFSSNKYANYLPIFTFLSAVIRIIVVHGSLWVARPLSTIKKLLGNVKGQVFHDISLQLSVLIVFFQSIVLFAV